MGIRMRGMGIEMSGENENVIEVLAENGNESTGLGRNGIEVLD